MKTKLMVLFTGTLLSGCVSTGVLFQDGKTAGKKEGDVAVGISYNLVPSYKSDTVLQQVKLDPFTVPTPWVSLEAQYGVTERLDLGGSGGLGLFAGGLNGFAKYALVPNDGMFNISLYGAAGFSASNNRVENAAVTFGQLMAGIPFSFDVTETSTLVI